MDSHIITYIEIVYIYPSTSLNYESGMFNINTTTILAFIATILLPGLLHNGIAQDTNLVAFRYFPLPIVSMVCDYNGLIWFNTNEDLYRLEEKSFKWEKKLNERMTLVLKEGKLEAYTALWGGEGKVLNPPWDTTWASRLHSSNNKYFTAADKRGITWVTNGEGFYGFKITPYLKRSLLGHSLRGIYLCGNDLYINSYSGLFKNGTLLPERKIYSSGNTLCVDTNDLWIASRHILRWNTSQNRLLKLPYRNPSRIPIGEFTYIHQTKNGDIWAGGTSGLFRIVNDSVVETDFTQPVEYIYSQDTSIVLACKFGIYIGNGKSFAALKAFPAITFNSIQKIDDSWWGCSKNGIWECKEGDKHAKQWFSDLPFSKLETYGILRDKNGYFWVSSSSGLHRLRRNIPVVESFLANVEFNKRSFASVRDSFYFGSVNGLVLFNPLAFPPLDIQKVPVKPYTSILLLISALLLSGVVTSFFYMRWRKVQLQLENVQMNQLSKEPEPFLTDLETYIWNNIQTVTVISLSEFSGLSERAFYRFLRENYQTKPGILIRNVKMKKMQQLCDEYPDISRDKLAYELGYSVSNVIRIQTELEKSRSPGP